MIQKTRIPYYSEKIIECGRDQKALFKITGALLGKQTKAVRPSGEVTLVAENFNIFFIEKVRKIRSGFPSTLDKYDEYDTVPTAEPLVLTPATIEEIITIVHKSRSGSIMAYQGLTPSISNAHLLCC